MGMTVSFCVIAYNEAEALPQLLGDLAAQDYPKKQIEVILVDGDSTDRTKAVMKEFEETHKESYSRIVVADNKKRKLAPGWNVALKLVRGDIILKVDAHARIPEDFVRRNVELQEEGEYITGGPRPCMPAKDTPWQRTLLLAEESMFGSGIADFRRKSERKYVKSMFHAAYRREVFEKAGEFNEDLGRTEDNEMHYRMSRLGYRFCYDPSIQSYQYIRGSLGKMMKQKAGNGYWVVLTAKVCPQCLSVYHFVPLAFVSSIIGTTVLARFGRKLPAKLLWSAYGLGAAAMSAAAVHKKEKHLSQLALPFLFLLLHVSYGVGSLAGVVRLPFWKAGEKRGRRNK